MADNDLEKVARELESLVEVARESRSYLETIKETIVRIESYLDQDLPKILDGIEALRNK